MVDPKQRRGGSPDASRRIPREVADAGRALQGAVAAVTAPLTEQIRDIGEKAGSADGKAVRAEAKADAAQAAITDAAEKADRAEKAATAAQATADAAQAAAAEAQATADGAADVMSAAGTAQGTAEAAQAAAEQVGENVDQLGGALLELESAVGSPANYDPEDKGGTVLERLDGAETHFQNAVRLANRADHEAKTAHERADAVATAATEVAVLIGAPVDYDTDSQGTFMSRLETAEVHSRDAASVAKQASEAAGAAGDVAAEAKAAAAEAQATASGLRTDLDEQGGAVVEAVDLVDQLKQRVEALGEVVTVEDVTRIAGEVLGEAEQKLTGIVQGAEQKATDAEQAAQEAIDAMTARAAEIEEQLGAVREHLDRITATLGQQAPEPTISERELTGRLETALEALQTSDGEAYNGFMGEIDELMVQRTELGESTYLSRLEALVARAEQKAAPSSGESG